MNLGDLLFLLDGLRLLVDDRFGCLIADNRLGFWLLVVDRLGECLLNRLLCLRGLKFDVLNGLGSLDLGCTTEAVGVEVNLSTGFVFVVDGDPSVAGD